MPHKNDFTHTELWSDNRYAVFCIIISLVIGYVLATALIIFQLNKYSFTVPVVFSAALFILQPKTRPNVKGYVTKLILGEVPVIDNFNFKIEDERHVIKIHNEEGDATIKRIIKIENEPNDTILTGNDHSFSFNEGKIIDVYEDENGDEIPVKCVDHEDWELPPEVIVNDEVALEFILPYSSPIEPGQKYEYSITLGCVEGAFPIEDSTDTWSAKFYVPAEEFSIELDYQFDIGEIVSGGELTNTKTGDVIASPNVDEVTNTVSVEASDLNPGSYQFAWNKS